MTAIALRDTIKYPLRYITEPLGSNEVNIIPVNREIKPANIIDVPTKILIASIVNSFQRQKGHIPKDVALIN